MSYTYAGYHHRKGDIPQPYQQPCNYLNGTDPYAQPPYSTRHQFQFGQYDTSYNQTERRSPSPPNAYQQRHPNQARRRTSWDPPWLHQPTEYQQPPSYEPEMYSPPPHRRRPTGWDPPAYWETPRQRPFHEVSADDQSPPLHSAPNYWYPPPPQSPNSAYDQPLPLDRNSRGNQPYTTHEEAPPPHTFDSGYSTRQPTSGQPCPATTTASPNLTQLQQLLEACYKIESRLDAADRRIDIMLPPEQPEPAQPYGSQTFGSGDLVQHLPPSGNSKASLGPSDLAPYDLLAPLQQSSTTPLPFALLPDTALKPLPPPYAASQNTRSELLSWQVEYRSSAYALSKTSDGDVLECNKKEILIFNCDRVEEGFDDSSEKILHSSSHFCGVEKVDIDGNLEAHEDDVARELKSVEEKKPILFIKDKLVHMCVEEDEAPPDHGVLTPLKNWLKLLPGGNGSLPSINVCAAILRIFFDLPISLDQFGQREQLKKNYLGKDIMFLSKSDEETRSNQKIAQELVNKWSHLVFNKRPPSVYFYGNNEGRDHQPFSMRLI